MDIIFAPIILFVYNRPSHTKQVLEALSLNPEAKKSDIYIYCDGAKLVATVEDLEKIKETRRIIKEENRFKNIIIIERDQNFGLANSIIAGVEYVVNKHGKAIILEDDILPSIGFLKYMNEALTLYDNELSVGCIHAWNYHLDTANCHNTSFFLKGSDCWGWGTWLRAWNLFNPDGKVLLQNIRDRKIEFEINRNGTFPFVEMLTDQVAGKIDSWAIRWYVSLFLENKFCLHPSRPIVKNIGFDNSGVHCGELDIQQEPVNYIDLSKIPIEESKWFFDEYRKYEKIKLKKNKITLVEKIKTKIRKFVSDFY